MSAGPTEPAPERVRYPTKRCGAALGAWGVLITSGRPFCFVPMCQKCGKLISPKKYARHLKRCGTTHMHHSN